MMTDRILKFKNEMTTHYWSYLIIILSNAGYRGI